MMHAVQKVMGEDSIGHKYHRFIGGDCKEKLPFTINSERYHISKDERDHSDIATWISEHKKDPAFKVCGHCSTILVQHL